MKLFETTLFVLFPLHDR